MKLASRRDRAALLGALVGLILGYPISYFCQSGALRAKVSLGGYIQHASDVLRSKDLAPTAIIAWAVAIFVFALIGWALAYAANKSAKQSETSEIKQ